MRWTLRILAPLLLLQLLVGPAFGREWPLPEWVLTDRAILDEAGAESTRAFVAAHNEDLQLTYDSFKLRDHTLEHPVHGWQGSTESRHKADLELVSCLFPSPVADETTPPRCPTRSCRTSSMSTLTRCVVAFSVSAAGR